MKKSQRLKTDKKYRDAFVQSLINIGIPFQIRALRRGKDWDQARLALEAGMAQPRISAMERPGRASLNLKTLIRLASAFDVGLLVKFASYSELARWDESFSPETFSIPKILGTRRRRRYKKKA